MRLFFDTSALIKKYISETGSGIVDELMNNAEIIFVSVITEIETHSTFKRLKIEKAIGSGDYEILKDEFDFDFQYYSAVPFSDSISSIARYLIEKYQLKSLDSIQMASALFIKDEINSIVACDQKIIKAAKKEGLRVINPNIKQKM